MYTGECINRALEPLLGESVIDNKSRWDGATSVEEVMTHLHAYVMSKQVLYLGISDTPAWVVVKANECKLSMSVFLDIVKDGSYYHVFDVNC